MKSTVKFSEGYIPNEKDKPVQLRSGVLRRLIHPNLSVKSKNRDISICKPSWVIGHLESRADLRLLFYSERGWHGHYDVVACIKDSK